MEAKALAHREKNAVRMIRQQLSAMLQDKKWNRRQEDEAREFLQEHWHYLTPHYPKMLDVSPDELLVSLDEIWDECEATDKPFTVGLALLKLGITWDSLLYLDGSRSSDEEIDDILNLIYSRVAKRIRLMAHVYLEGRLHQKAQAAGPIFALKNRFGWKDQREVKLDGRIVREEWGTDADDNVVDATWSEANPESLKTVIIDAEAYGEEEEDSSEETLSMGEPGEDE